MIDKRKNVGVYVVHSNLWAGEMIMRCPEVTKLYKYRNFSARSLSMLKNNEMYFAESSTFNDPFDCRGSKAAGISDDDFIEKVSGHEALQQKISKDDAECYLKQIVADGKKGEYLDDTPARYQDMVLPKLGICSFSRTREDILMWSHYSDSHKGFCLEFVRSPENMLKSAMPVEYPDDDGFPCVDYWSKATKVDELKKIVTTKSKHWEYEKEWRIVKAHNSAEKNYKGHVDIYPEDMLSGVIFGVKMPKSDRETIKSVIAGKRINLYEAIIEKNMFRLKIIDCV